MHFAKDEETKIVAGFIRDISRTFATDALKPAVLSPTERYICFNRFMVWREEQRGIGEMMCVGHDGKPASCAGYASFVNQYEERYSKWFTAIANDLQSFAKDRQSKAVDDSERLRQLQSLLAKLVTQLDEEKAYMRLNDMGKPEEQRWIARAEEPSRRSKDRLAKINITP
jgi:hypothetical protein